MLLVFFLELCDIRIWFKIKYHEIAIEVLEKFFGLKFI